MEAFVANLTALLRKTVEGDTAQIRAATSALSGQYLNKPQCVAALYTIATSNQSPDPPSNETHIRQLAAVELRKRLSRHWAKINTHDRIILENGLLSKLPTEPVKLIRHALCRCVAEIAALELPEGRWTDLLQWLVKCSNNRSSVVEREIALFVISNLLDTVPEYMADHIPQLFMLFGNTISDPESLNVRISTMEALGKLGEYVDPTNKEEIKGFRKCIPAMTDVLKTALAAGDEELSQRGIEVFDNLLLKEAPLLSQHLPSLLEFFVSISIDKNHEASIRNLALNFLAYASQIHRSRVQKLKLGPAILSSVIPIMAEIELDDKDEAEEDEPWRMAASVVATLALHFPPPHILPTILAKSEEFMNSPEPGLRFAALMCIAVTVEGVADAMRSHFNGVMNMVIRGLSDPVDVVKGGACRALVNLSEHLDSELSAFQGSILPLLFPLLTTTNVSLQKQVTNALDALIESLTAEQLTPYLSSLIEALLYIVRNASADLTVKATAMSAIGSTALCAGELFKPYFSGVMETISGCLVLDKEEEMLLRGISIDTVGACIEAVGKDVARPYLEGLMSNLLQTLDLNNGRLRESSYTFFVVMSRISGDEFAVFLPRIIPYIIQSLSQEEGSLNGDDELDALANSNAEDLEDEDKQATRYRGHSAISEEKETAADVIGDIFINTAKHFMPYYKTCLDLVVNLTDYWHEGVRKAAASSCLKFVSGLWRLSQNPETASLVNAEMFGQVSAQVLKALIQMLGDEDDRMSVQNTLCDLAETLKLIGSTMLSSSQELVEPLLHQVMLCLAKRHPCQLAEDDLDQVDGHGGDDEEGNDGEESGDMEESAELDALVVSTACDMVSALAGAFGASFAMYFIHFFPAITKYYSKKLPSVDRSMAIGCIGECIAGMKEGASDFAEPVLKLCATVLKDDDDDEVKSNAAFAAGYAFLTGPAHVVSYYMDLLQLLSPIFQSTSQSTVNILDNACGCVARMIKRDAASLPLDQVLPVLLSKLPLKTDYEENEPIYDALCSLIKGQNAAIQPHLPKLVSIFAQVLSPPDNQLRPHTRQMVVEVLKDLHGKGNVDFASIVSALGEEVGSALQRSLAIL